MAYDKAVKARIIADLPHYIQQYCTTEKGFSTVKGGLFRCPVCGGKSKLYRQSNPGYPYTVKTFQCDHLSPGSEYPGDSFGIYAATHDLTTAEAFRELMETEGGYAPPSPDSAERLREQEEKRRQEALRWEQMKAESLSQNRDALESKVSWGTDMEEAGKSLLETRGLHVEDLPASYARLMGYLPKTTFISQYQDSHYPIEGIVFKLGTEAYQIRKTHGSTYVGKEEKTSRFMTLGDAFPFGLEAEDTDSSDPLFITEGPFDALSIVAAGAKRVVSLQGCANLSRIVENLRAIPRRGRCVLLAFDADEAGKEHMDILHKELQDSPVIPIKAPLFADGKQGISDASDWLQKDPEGLKALVRILRMEGWLFGRGWEEESHYELLLGYWKSCSPEERKRATMEVVKELKDQYQWYLKGEEKV